MTRTYVNPETGDTITYSGGLADRIERAAIRSGAPYCAACERHHDGAAWSPYAGWHEPRRTERENPGSRFRTARVEQRAY